MRSCPTCQRGFTDEVAHCPEDGTPLPLPLPERGAELIGTVLGERYRLLSILGRGGMGTVYLCEHVVLGRRMAVKVLRPEFSADEELARRFQQEAVAASQIGQENIVTVTDFGRTPDASLYFVMEALEGESLTALARRGPVALPRAVGILAQLCRALAAAHARGIIHRDLKPDNVMVVPREDGTDLVKVVDFGISKIGRGHDGQISTSAGMVIGTPAYMAPEQAVGGRVDARTDIYAFGVVAYELLTGRLPFVGSDPIATLVAHREQPVVPPHSWRPDLPGELDRLVVWTLAKLPEDRPLDMIEVGQVLSVTGLHLGLAPVFPPVRQPTGEPVVIFNSERGLTIPHGLPAPMASERRAVVTLPPRRRAWPWLAVAGLAVALATGYVVRLVAPEPGPAEVDRPPATRAPSLVSAPPRVVPASIAPAPRAEPPPEPASPVPAPPPAVTQTPRAATVTRTVKVGSIPSGAEIWMGRRLLAETPYLVTLGPGEQVELRLELPGYRAEVRTISAGDGAVTVRLAREAASKVGLPPATDDNPFDKVDDLKPDPFK